MGEGARYPGYDVLAKRDGPSWNDATRRTIDRRLATPSQPRFFNAVQWRTLEAVCARIIPQPVTREPVPLAALLDARILSGRTDGYRRSELPSFAEAWRTGLDALEAEALARQCGSFATLSTEEQAILLELMQRGELVSAAWNGMSSAEFFAHRLLLDIVSLYYAHPTAWNEIGFGGPASPRGYVRMDFDRRDPWEAVEGDPSEAPVANAERDAIALRENQRVR